jgi:hypothetical protein
MTENILPVSANPNVGEFVHLHWRLAYQERSGRGDTRRARRNTILPTAVSPRPLRIAASAAFLIRRSKFKACTFLKMRLVPQN